MSFLKHDCFFLSNISYTGEARGPSNNQYSCSESIRAVSFCASRGTGSIIDYWLWKTQQSHLNSLLPNHCDSLHTHSSTHTCRKTNSLCVTTSQQYIWRVKWDCRLWSFWVLLSSELLELKMTVLLGEKENKLLCLILKMGNKESI